MSLWFLRALYQAVIICVFCFLAYGVDYAHPGNGQPCDYMELGMAAYTCGIFVQTLTIAFETQCVALCVCVSECVCADISLKLFHVAEPRCDLGHAGAVFCHHVGSAERRGAGPVQHHEPPVLGSVLLVSCRCTRARKACPLSADSGHRSCARWRV
jgi:hypothetical protein